MIGTSVSGQRYTVSISNETIGLFVNSVLSLLNRLCGINILPTLNVVANNCVHICLLLEKIIGLLGNDGMVSSW